MGDLWKKQIFDPDFAAVEGNLPDHMRSCTLCLMTVF